MRPSTERSLWHPLVWALTPSSPHSLHAFNPFPSPYHWMFHLREKSRVQTQRCLQCRSRWEEGDLLRINGAKTNSTLHFLFFRSTSLYEMSASDHGIRDSSEKNRWKRTRMHVSPTWIILLVGW